MLCRGSQSKKRCASQEPGLLPLEAFFLWSREAEVVLTLPTVEAFTAPQEARGARPRDMGSAGGVALMIFESGMHFDFEKVAAPSGEGRGRAAHSDVSGGCSVASPRRSIARGST